jgi:hypothetical protein
VAYAWWWLGVTIALAGMGFAVGYSILAVVGLELGLVATVVGIVFGTAVAAACWLLGLPRLAMIAVTAAWDAGAVLTGVLVLLGRIPTDAIGYGGLDAVAREAPIWIFVWAALVGVGSVVQLRSSDDRALVPSDQLSSIPRAIDPRIPGSF